jgi:adenine-specific DNA-methyltransferase
MGSIFVQIGQENVHLIRTLLDERFGVENFVAMVTFRTTANLVSGALGSNSNYLLWYARKRESMKYRQLYLSRTLDDDIGGRYMRLELPDGTRRPMTQAERDEPGGLPNNARIYRHDNLTSQGAAASTVPFEFEGTTYHPGANRHWTTTVERLDRLRQTRRLAAPTRDSLAYVRYLADFPVGELTNVWTDTQTGAFTDTKVFVVQTNTKVIQRCLLMATDPGDLVLDPTCGSGTTAVVAEQWGRRWITIDTSRVALSLARQRLLTAKYDYFRLNDASAGIVSGFALRSVPHITPKSIAQNANLDPIFAKHDPILEVKLAEANAALAQTPDKFR